ncbi:LacI-family regulatory protein [Bacillus sp. JCM 19046]|nr:LacI-family regulatory protein [Bacillus sp. JCM 19045]GAF17740.1 LacI-family regulatory protein [Bacillus sp. JCM 19046]
MPTLKDVAKMAKVSVSTASYAMNGSSLILPETKQRVYDAAKELGYRINGSAKNLKKSKTEIVAVFISGFTGPVFNEMLEGVHDYVAKQGYELVVCASNDKHRLIVENHFDGAIVLNYHMEDELLEMVASEKMPIVVLDRESNNPHIHPLLLPNESGVKQTLEVIVAEGHKRIGFMAGQEVSFDGEKRFDAYQLFMQEHDLPVYYGDLIRADFTESSGYECMQGYLQRQEGKTTATAFICANDEMAIGAMRAIKEKGLKIPEDIAIAGFDDIPTAKYTDPALTTVRVNKKQWGKEAAKRLLDVIEKKTLENIEETRVDLIRRRSL